MDIQIIFKITYDRGKDGSLSDFRQKKYMPFKAHIERMQMTGILPRGPVLFSISSTTGRPDGPEDPAPVTAQVIPFTRIMGSAPRLVHAQGTPLRMLSAAMPTKIAV